MWIEVYCENMSKRMALFLLLILCFAGFVFGLYAMVGRTNPKLPVSRVSIGGKTFLAERAETILARTRGLSGRDSLPEDGGMIFIFSSSTTGGFWMKDMKFAIDTVWFRKSSPLKILTGKTWEGKVVGVKENMRPELGKQLWSLKIYYPPKSIDAALELNAGAVKKYGIQAGDTVVIM